MASIQRIGFTRYQNDLSKIFKALGHPARIAILNVLTERDDVICKELAYETGFSAPTVTHHLQILMESGLVGYEKIANMSCYVVNPMLIDKAKQGLRSIQNQAENKTINYQNVIFSQHPFSESF